MDCDSDQSEDLFGDDDNDVSVRGSSIQSPEIDASFRLFPSTQPYGYSPYKSAVTAPECPTTPCSLGQFLTKAPNWTADLETPVANKVRVTEDSPCAVNQENLNSNQNLRLTPDLNSEDAIPVSPIIPKKKKKRRSRRILSNISNVTPKSSLRENLDGTESSIFLSPIAEKSTEDKLDDSYHSLSLSSNQSSQPSSSSGITADSLSPVERVRRLKALQASKICHVSKSETLKIPDDVFFKDYLALESSKYLRPQGQLTKPQGKGFVTFSQLANDKDLNDDHLPDESFMVEDLPFTQNFREDEEIPLEQKFEEDYMESDELIENLQVESPNFEGFSPGTRKQSQELLNKINSFTSEQSYLQLEESEDNFKGFGIDSRDESLKIAQKFHKFYDNYLDSVYPIGRIIKRKDLNHNMDQDKLNFVSALKTKVNSTIKTASNKDILISIKNVVLQEYLLLSDDDKHEIDLLVENRKESTPVKDSDQLKSEESKHSATDEFESLEFNCDLEEAVSRVESSGFDTLADKNSSLRNDQDKSICKVNLELNNYNFNPVVTSDAFKEPVKLPVKPSTNNQVNSINLASNIFEDLQFEMNDFSGGFKTGRGKSIKVADNAIIKAKNIMSDDELNKINLEDKVSGVKDFNEPTASTSGFKVPRDENKGLGFGRNFTTKSKSKINIFDEDFGDLQINPTMGFTTGAGKSIKITESAMSRAQVAFAKDLETEDPESEIFALKNKKSEDNYRGLPIPSTSGFQTGKIIRVERKLNHRFSFPGPSTSSTSSESASVSGSLMIKNSAFINNARKRKSDEETPAGRKRLCVGMDLQKRKLFEEIEEEEEILQESAMMFERGPVTTDRNLDSTLKPERTDTNFNINLNSSNVINDDEVRASVDALLNEDIDFEAEDTWTEIDNPKPEKRSRSFPGFVSIKPDSIPEELYFETQFSQELNCDQDFREQRESAIFEQEKLIESKKRIKEKPITGSWLQFKQNKITLAEYAGNKPPEYCTVEEIEHKDLDPLILTITSATASTYKFTGAYFRDLRTKATVSVGDGAVLIPDVNNSAGIDEFYRSFSASPGVDPSLLPSGWFENHFKWIVWKLAAMDRIRFNNIDFNNSNQFLTPEALMRQLKYRYDREIDRSERPALRKILEKDDPPSRRLVLCVSKLTKDSIELTDGWYSIPASVDAAMQVYINSGKLQEGTKLMIQGAELLNLEEGRYPLEITKDVRFKIHTNSTRRARWDAKLGYQRSCGPLTVTLSSVKSNGGAIGKLIVAVSRVYPILYREKMSDGQSIIRNAKCEEKAALAFESEYQKRIEAIASFYSGSQSKYELETRVRNNLPTRRNVTTILKVKIADGGLSAMLTIWSCGEELVDSLKEESCVCIRNVSAGGRRANELQISAGKLSALERVPGKISCSPRTFTSIEEVSQRGFNPVYGEFDTVGIVVSTGPAPHGMKNYETVNLAFSSSSLGFDDDDYDGDNLKEDSSYLSILFWENIASNGFAGIATVGSIIACLNLEWRKSTYLSIPTAFCSERTLLTRNPRQHLRHPFECLTARIRDPVSYAAESAKKIQLEVEKKSKSSVTPNSDRRSSNSWTPERDYSLVNPDSVDRDALRKSAILNSQSRDKARWHEANESSVLCISNSPKVNSEFNLRFDRHKSG